MTKLMATQSQKSVERFHEIDLLRALACLMVVGFHYGYRGALDRWSPAAEPAWIASVTQYGYLGVHLFFIISGFVIFLSIRNASVQDFVASRISRLYPAFWVAVPVTWAMVCWSDLLDLQVSWQDMLINLTMVPHWFSAPYVDGAYWSLAVELQFYIFVGLMLYFKLERRVEWCLAGWLVVALLNAIRPMYPVEFWLAANWAPLFTIGALAYRIRSQGLNPTRLGLMFFSSALSFYYAVKPVMMPKVSEAAAQNAWVVAGLLSMFVFIFLMIALGRFKAKKYFMVSFAGILTYPVYLLHEYIGYVFLTHFARQNLTYITNFILVLGGVLVSAWFLNKFVEQPMAPWLRRILKGKTVPGVQP